MIKKKVLLFIVEGRTDEAALQGVLSELLTDKKIRFHVIGADITTSERRGTASVKTMVNDLVRKFVNTYRLQPSDVMQVAHLMDTDGAFVPDTAITEDKTACGFEYTRDRITAASAADVIHRNKIKSMNMLLLAHMGKTYKKIPYEAYFCSRNLEHALYGIEGNCTAREKINLSDRFDEQYRNTPSAFLRFISTVPPAVPCNAYVESWNYISDSNTLHSLERGCNLHVLLSRILNPHRQK